MFTKTFVETSRFFFLSLYLSRCPLFFCLPGWLQRLMGGCPSFSSFPLSSPPLSFSASLNNQFLASSYLFAFPFLQLCLWCIPTCFPSSCPSIYPHISHTVSTMTLTPRLHNLFAHCAFFSNFRHSSFSPFLWHFSNRYRFLHLTGFVPCRLGFCLPFVRFASCVSGS